MHQCMYQVCNKKNLLSQSIIISVFIKWTRHWSMVLSNCTWRSCSSSMHRKRLVSEEVHSAHSSRQCEHWNQTAAELCNVFMYVQVCNACIWTSSETSISLLCFIVCTQSCIMIKFYFNSLFTTVKNVKRKQPPWHTMNVCTVLSMHI